MPRWAAYILLILSPAALTAAGLAVLAFAAAWRRSFGASSMAAGAPVVIALAVLVHAGYLLAPVLYHRGAVRPGLWATAPLAVVATLGALAWLIANAGAVRDPECLLGVKPWAWIPPAMIIVYWMTPVALALGR